jgi:hypothetical protein
MFCSECGVKAAGKYCWSCGQALQSGGKTTDVADAVSIVPPTDWRCSLNCQSIMAVPEVRDRIQRAAATSKTKLTGEEFMEFFDSVGSALTGGVPLKLIAKISQPISEKMGLKTGKDRQEQVDESPGAVLVAILCSLAQNGQRVQHVEQFDGACKLQVSLPSDIWSLKGDLTVTVRAQSPGTAIEATLTIPGQLYDFGKSGRVLDRLFADIHQHARAA